MSQYIPFNNITSQQIGALPNFSANANLTLTQTGGGASSAYVVYEMLLTQKPLGGLPLFDIQVYAHSTGLTTTGNIGNYNDGTVTWVVSSTVTFGKPTVITFVPTSNTDELIYNLNFGGMLQWLIASPQSVLTGSEYFNGITLSPWPMTTTAIGSLTVNSLAMSFQPAVIVYKSYGSWTPESAGIQSAFYYNQQEWAGGGATNMGPYGTVTPGANQFIDRCTINNPSIFPQNVDIYSNWGNNTGGVRSACAMIYCNAEGSQGNVGIPFRTQSWVPQNCQIANLDTFLIGYDLTFTPGGSWDVICDYFNEGEQDPQATTPYAPYRQYEIDFTVYAVGSFGSTGRRIFTMAGAGDWSGADVWYAIFPWRFITARNTGTSASSSVKNADLGAMHRQLLWHGMFSSGREWNLGHGLMSEPITGVAAWHINNYSGTFTSHPNIVIAAAGTGSRAYPRGNHFVGAGLGQNCTAVYPNAYATYDMRRYFDRMLVRSNNDMTTLDYVSTRNSAGAMTVTSDGVDKIQFSDRTCTIANMPAVADTGFDVVGPFTTGKAVATLQASNTPTAWSIINGDPNGCFAIDNSGNVTLTANAAANLPYYVWNNDAAMTGQSSNKSGQNVRIAFTFQSMTPSGTGMGHELSGRYLQLIFRAGTSTNAAQIDSCWIGKSYGQGHWVPELSPPIQVTFAGSNSVALPNGGGTVTSDPVLLPYCYETTYIMVSFHCSGTAATFASDSHTSGGGDYASSNGPDIGPAWTLANQSGYGGFNNHIAITKIAQGIVTTDVEVQASNAAGKSVGLLSMNSFNNYGAFVAHVAPLAIFTFTANPAAGSSITIGTSIVTFVSAAPTGLQVLIGASLVATVSNLLTFLQASADSQIVQCTYSLGSYQQVGDRVMAVGKVQGTSMNSFAATASTSPASGCGVWGYSWSSGSFANTSPTTLTAGAFSGNTSQNITVGPSNPYGNTATRLTPRYLTAQATTTSANGDIVLIDAAVKHARYYCELHLDNLDGAGSIGLGIGTNATITNFLLGSDTHSVGAFADSSGGLINTNNANVGSMGANSATGDYLCMALLVENAVCKVWFRHCAGATVGNWNNSALADPAAGTAGIDLTTLNAFVNGASYGPNLVAAVYLKNNSTGAQATINTGQNSWAYVCPSGYTGWHVNLGG